MRTATSTVLLLAILVAAGCSAGAIGQDANASAGPYALRITAKDLSFSAGTLAAPAGKPFQIAFDNQDAAPHNVAIYRDASAAEKIFVSDPFRGSALVVYDVPALQSGTYYFRCDVHPAMRGELTAR
jgi:plastocyanin